MNIIKCEYNMDSGKVEVLYDNETTIVLNCSEIEANLNTTIYSRSKLQWLLDNEPLAYLELALSNELQDYCDQAGSHMAEQSNVIFHKFTDSGYSEKASESFISEFFMYEH